LKDNAAEGNGLDLSLQACSDAFLDSRMLLWALPSVFAVTVKKERGAFKFPSKLMVTTTR
jgi:hypothetical protein